MSRIITLLVVIASFACNDRSNGQSAKDKMVVSDSLPDPYATESVRNSPKVIGWPENKKPAAPAGFKVSKYADGFNNPRWIYIGPNGDVFISEAKTGLNPANRISILRDADGDGKPELRKVLLEKLNRPFGMLILNGYFYVANTDGIFRYPYKVGETSITGNPVKILELPAGGYNNHWTRNIMANEAGTKIYVTVGSGSNVAEHGIENEQRRANIIEINPDGSGARIFASGLRNPVGLSWEPKTKKLWTAVNERDRLGDDLVPDFITSVKDGGFYGWPYSYFGQHEDPRLKGQRPDLVKSAIVPDLALGSHTASLGLVFYDKKKFPAKYQGGAFVGQHGSWNRSVITGFEVLFVPFKDGKPTGETEDFLTGFIADKNKPEVYGKPVGVAVLPDGSMLVADDAGNTIWRVSY